MTDEERAQSASPPATQGEDTDTTPKKGTSLPPVAPGGTGPRAQSGRNIEARRPNTSFGSTPRRSPSQSSLWSVGEPSRMLAAKKARQHAESDAELLKNRIKRLQQEQAKSQKKIEETIKRAQEIRALKKRNAEAARAKQRQKELEEAAMKRERRMLAERREQQERARKATQAAVARQKREEVAAMKRISMENEMAIKRSKNEERMKAMRNKESVRQREKNFTEKKLQYREKLHTHLSHDFEDKLTMEENLKRKAETTVAKMEREEEQLIAKLREAQEAQRRAYEELESALTDTM